MSENQKPTLVIVPRTSSAGGFSETLSEKAAERAEDALGALGEVVGEAASKFWDSLTVKAKPSEVELSLEVALEGKQTWILVEGKASAKASIKLKWTNE